MNAGEYGNILNTLYKPSVKTAEIVSVPAMRFVMADGQGDPNTSRDFEDAVGALYAVSGLCCQMMHIGPYDAEPASFERMMKYCDESGFRRLEKSHHEIYMSDARRTATEKLKTILRFKVIKDK